MKLAIIGSRDFSDYEIVKQEFLKLKEVTRIISGGAKGADALAEKISNEFDIPITIYKPDWNQFGRSAGPIRNKLIISDADYVLAFWDGVSKGTKSSIDIAGKTKTDINIIYTDSTKEYDENLF
jgi:predicted Rossmann fold nucleotide-binding protein DprA/Smf involved in DNA uptake